MTRVDEMFEDRDYGEPVKEAYDIKFPMNDEEFDQCQEKTQLFYGGHQVAEFQCSLDKAHADPETDEIYEGSMSLHTAYHEETGEFLAEWSTGTVFHATFTSEGGQAGRVVESVEGQPEE